MDDVENAVIFSVCVPSEPVEVAAALRDISRRIEREGLCLISIYSTGFGEPWEACLQVVATRLGDPSLAR